MKHIPMLGFEFQITVQNNSDMFHHPPLFSKERIVAIGVVFVIQKHFFVQYLNSRCVATGCAEEAIENKTLIKHANKFVSGTPSTVISASTIPIELCNPY